MPADMMQWLKKHWLAFWRSGSENLYTFLWWGIFGTVVALVLAVGSWALPRLTALNPTLTALVGKWEDRFISAFVAVLLVVLASIIATWIRQHRASRPLAQTASHSAETAVGPAISLAPHQSAPKGEAPKSATDPIPTEASTRDFMPPASVPNLPRDSERASRYFNRFNPPRPMIDLPEADWLALGTLYSIDVQRGTANGKPWENRYLTLLFLPDTRPEAPYSLLLLLYGYWKIYGYKEVRASHLEECLFRSGLREPRRPFEFLMVASMFDDRRLNVDDVAKTNAIDGLVSEKVSLAKGGFYNLTEKGMKKAEEMFADLVRRA